MPPPDGPGPTESAGSGLGPSYALLRAVFKDQIPNGPLGPDTVPAALLALPIALATENLVQHAKKCPNVHCLHVPQPLQPYRHMRPDAIRRAPDQVHKVLWTHADHELVIWVRKQILEKYRQLANEIATGVVLAG